VDRGCRPVAESGKLMNKASTLSAVIAAAGSSQRMDGVNKLFVSLGSKPLLAWSVDTCEACSLVRQIVLVMNDQDWTSAQRLKEERSWSKVTVCRGGARRQDSVREGLRHIKHSALVMIHDGARPFLAPNLIADGLQAASQTGAALAAVPVKDTIKAVDHEGLVGETLPRDKIWAAQTPQVFRLDLITRAYENLQEDVTDDATAVERLGHKVRLYMGDYRNIKVTTPEDLFMARIIAEGMGHG